jgi:hypothetical protein
VECPNEIKLPTKKTSELSNARIFFPVHQNFCSKNSNCPCFFHRLHHHPTLSTPFIFFFLLSLSFVLVGGWLDGSLKLERSPLKI